MSALLLLGFNGFGQNHKNIILQIDTLELNGCDIFSVGLLPNSFGNVSIGIEKTNSIFSENYPNFICPIE
jgi:hypothetical protein